MEEKNMGKVIFNMSMSLDGFVAGPQDEVDHLFGWYFGGDTPIETQRGNMVLKVSPMSAELLKETFQTGGALVTGRKTFDIAGAWAGNPPLEPCFVLTHTVPKEWVKEGSPFTFVTDGIASAGRQAKQAAGDKNVVIGTASTLQQCLNARLLDEITIDLVPVVLGAGIRLFDRLSTAPIGLEITRVVDAPGVTHLRYRVVYEPTSPGG
jgi:dihydrofolate reductase